MCAIAGAFNVPNAAYVTQLMLKAMQHRGQEAAGIATSTLDDKGDFLRHKDAGLVDEVFRGFSFDTGLPGRTAIGHTRYRTTGGSNDPKNIQPLAVKMQKLPVALVHNGNLTDYPAFRKKFEAQGSVFHSSSDSELFLHLLARSREPTFDARLLDALQQPSGAWSLLVMTPDALYATTDPYGFRPLVMAEYEGGLVFASETCALDLLGVEPKRHLERGEILKVTSEGVTLSTLPDLPPAGRSCSFEHIYFSRPDSYAFGSSSGAVRERVGQLLARSAPADVDLVTSVPDSSNAMAAAYADELFISRKPALVKNHYMGRTFITPGQVSREFGVRVKLNAARYIVEGKRVAVVDDSLVRGTTMRKVVKLLREKGATEVHVRIGSPPVIHPCFWGIDTPTAEELIATRQDTAALAKIIGADSLAYLSEADLLVALRDIGQQRYCTTCFSGRQPHEPFVPASSLVRK